MLNTLFWVFAVLSGVLALIAVHSKHILRAVIALMGVLCLTAGFYLLLSAEFLAGAQILVYVGGVVVLLVFAVMLTRSQELTEDAPSLTRRVLGALGSLSLFGLGACAIHSSITDITLSGVSPADAGTDVMALGRAFLDPGAKGYLLPFEVISFLLLAVLVAGIVIGRKEPQS